jgi:predicted amidohydrolase
MQIYKMMAIFLVTLLSGCASLTSDRVSVTEFQADLVPLKRIDHRGSIPVQLFATYGQCQIDLPIKEAKNQVFSVMHEDNEAKIRSCIRTAERERVNVLILPELALSFVEAMRITLIKELQKTAKQSGMVIIAGSYYDSQNFSRLVVIGPEWYEEGYKIHPSRYEASPAYGRGMRPGLEIMLIDTPYGRILPITCVDLISDSIQYQVRNLSNRNQLDVLVNLNYNPASWEFLVEANSIARRHGVFVTITNIAIWPAAREMCQKSGDNGFCGGNTALFGSVRSDPKDCPNCIQSLLPQLPANFHASGKRNVPYDSIVADIPPLQESLLVYDLNLRLLREPASTNAPDQGYPAIRNIRYVPLW